MRESLHSSSVRLAAAPRRAGPCFPVNRSAFSTKKRLYYGARTTPLSLSLFLFLAILSSPFTKPLSLPVLYLYLSRRMNHTSIFTHQPCRWYTENWSDSSYGLLTHSIFVPMVVVQTFDAKRCNVGTRHAYSLSYSLCTRPLQLIIITRNN